jgi:hypothetical protein
MTRYALGYAYNVVFPKLHVLGTHYGPFRDWLGARIEESYTLDEWQSLYSQFLGDYAIIHDSPTILDARPFDAHASHSFPPPPFMAHHLANDRLLCIVERRGNVYVSKRGYCYHPESITADLQRYAQLMAESESALFITHHDALT